MSSIKSIVVNNVQYEIEDAVAREDISELEENVYSKTEVDTALEEKASTSVATTTANGLMSSTDKSEIAALQALTTTAIQGWFN